MNVSNQQNQHGDRFLFNVRRFVEEYRDGLHSTHQRGSKHMNLEMQTVVWLIFSACQVWIYYESNTINTRKEHVNFRKPFVICPKKAMQTYFRFSTTPPRNIATTPPRNIILKLNKIKCTPNEVFDMKMFIDIV